MASRTTVAAPASASELIRRLGDAKVNVAKVNDIGEAADHPQLAALGPIVERQLLEQKNAVGQAPELLVGVLAGAIVGGKPGFTKIMVKTTPVTRVDVAADVARRIDAFVRGLDPVPGAWTTLRGKRVKVLLAEEADFEGLDAGTLSEREGALFAGTSARALELVLVQLQGKRAMSGGEAARGLRLAAGEGFE